MTQIERRLQGLPVSEGCAVARVCLFNENRHIHLPFFHVQATETEREEGRVQQAIREAGDRLDEVRRKVAEQIGPAEAEIFVAQKMILTDGSLRQSILRAIHDNRLNAEAAISVALDALETRILALDNAYVKERANDFGEVKRRLLDVLGNLRPSFQCAGEHCQKGHNRIVVAEELTPTLTTDMDVAHTMGFVTERGGRTSHAAILARALGIPAVSNLPGIRDQIPCGTEVLVNGDTGEVVICPREETVLAMAGNRPGVRTPQLVEPIRGFTVMANISVAAEAGFAASMKADGIGLYRTEFEVMAAGRRLKEKELLPGYVAALRAMEGRPVFFRLFDVGSDKPLPGVTLPTEGNPALGWRGARLLQGERDLFRAQARALARASGEGPVSVLYPMIVDAEQFADLRGRFEDAIRGIRHGTIRHGPMFEVPSACLQAPDLMRHGDFASIGTNDLMQYLFAVDRNNEKVAHDAKPDHPVLWNLIRSVVRAGARARKVVSICGELAGDPRSIPWILSAGVRSVSVSARRIPATRTAALAARRRGRASTGQSQSRTEQSSRQSKEA